MSAEPLGTDEVRTFDVFTGDTESDPHRVACWTIVVSAHGLTLGYADVPARHVEASSVQWHELHDMLSVRDALYADLESMREEKERESAELASLRARRRRLQAQVEALNQRLATTMPVEGDGIIPMRRT